MLLVVPFTAFKEDTVNKDTIIGLFFDVFVGHVILDVIIECYSVDGDLVLSGEVLESTCKEGLREEETREPELNRSTRSNPIVQEIDSIIAVIDPRSEWLHRKE